MKAFFKVQDVAAVHALAQKLATLPPEEVPLDQALGRALALPLTAPSDLPGFARATMDGYALRAMDTFGAGETSPGYLEIIGDVRMGQTPEFSVGPGQCARIGTGGMLPVGADAVVMVEHTRLLDDTSLEVATSVAPGGNTLGPTDDASQGQELLPRGQCLRPQDLGLLAALGQQRVLVTRRPRVGIISTGDEVVPVEASPAPGQVRDVNTHTLAAQVVRAGGEPVPLGLVPDNAQALKAVTARSLDSCDLTLLSGGSSVGVRDFTSEVFLSFPGAELLVHGVAVSPGKPFLWARTPSGHLLGLPGQVASCLVSFYLLVEPILERLQGRPALPFTRFARLPAVLTRNIPSAPGREEYLRVSLSQENGGWLAQPLFGKSGLLTTMIQGQGLVRVPKDCEGLDAAEAVEVLLFPN
ncbi:MAG: molybdopterin molybdotransferase MoeA [Deltaproteobacteria bacterium]|nr:molybdopterin molybdotransferase MoeA [Deltaproteobacteria bacterium]